MPAVNAGAAAATGVCDSRSGQGVKRAYFFAMNVYFPLSSDSLSSQMTIEGFSLSEMSAPERSHREQLTTSVRGPTKLQLA